MYTWLHLKVQVHIHNCKYLKQIDLLPADNILVSSFLNTKLKHLKYIRHIELSRRYKYEERLISFLLQYKKNV